VEVSAFVCGLKQFSERVAATVICAPPPPLSSSSPPHRFVCVLCNYARGGGSLGLRREALVVLGQWKEEKGKCQGRRGGGTGGRPLLCVVRS